MQKANGGDDVPAGDTPGDDPEKNNEGGYFERGAQNDAERSNDFDADLMFGNARLTANSSESTYNTNDD